MRFLFLHNAIKHNIVDMRCGVLRHRPGRYLYIFQRPMLPYGRHQRHVTSTGYGGRGWTFYVWMFFRTSSSCCGCHCSCHHCHVYGPNGCQTIYHGTIRQRRYGHGRGRLGTNHLQPLPRCAFFRVGSSRRFVGVLH